VILGAFFALCTLHCKKTYGALCPAVHAQPAAEGLLKISVSAALAKIFSAGVLIVIRT
jgi:hypothetical protein